MGYLKQFDIKNYKWILVLSIIVVTGFSILIVGSAKESLQTRQMYGVIIAFIIMLVVSLIDFQWILKLYWAIYGVSVGLLLIVHFFGKNVNGATRWIDLGFTSFQPSEFIKIALIIFFAKYFQEIRHDISTFKSLLKTFALFGIPTVLVLVQPDLSTTLSIVAVFLILLYLSGLKYKIIVTTLLIIVPLTASVFLYIIQPDQQLFHDYQQTRVLAWLYPEEYADDAAYQQINSMIAIGSGQLTGKGLDNNTTTSVKNGNFILEPQTDFIFAIIGEELGFQGCCFVIILLFFIIMQCIMIGIRSQIFAGKLICYGVAAQIGFQSFINIGVATGLLPNTGIPLPFISYGLSSLVSLMAGMGIVLNIGLQQKKKHEGAHIHEHRFSST